MDSWPFHRHPSLSSSTRAPLEGGARFFFQGAGQGILFYKPFIEAGPGFNLSKGGFFSHGPKLVSFFFCLRLARGEKGILIGGLLQEFTFGRHQLSFPLPFQTSRKKHNWKLVWKEGMKVTKVKICDTMSDYQPNPSREVVNRRAITDRRSRTSLTNGL